MVTPMRKEADLIIAELDQNLGKQPNSLAAHPDEIRMVILIREIYSYRHILNEVHTWAQSQPDNTANIAHIRRLTSSENDEPGMVVEVLSGSPIELADEETI